MTASQQAVAAKLVEMGMSVAEAEALARDPENAPRQMVDRRFAGKPPVPEARPKREPAIPANLMAEVLRDGPHGHVRAVVERYGLNMNTVLYHRYRNRHGGNAEQPGAAARGAR